MSSNSKSSATLNGTPRISKEVKEQYLALRKAGVQRTVAARKCNIGGTTSVRLDKEYEIKSLNKDADIKLTTTQLDNIKRKDIKTIVPKVGIIQSVLNKLHSFAAGKETASKAVELFGETAVDAYNTKRDTANNAVFSAKEMAETDEMLASMLKKPSNYHDKKHFVIPDVQIKPGVNTDYLVRIGQFIVDKLPSTIICLGDFSDLPSLSSYDVGTKAYEGRRYSQDIAATKAAMADLLSPIWRYNSNQRALGLEEYKPRMVLTLGNHENRINRAVNSDPKLSGTISIDDLQYEEFGWEVVPFLVPIEIDGILYCHYMTSGAMGRPIGTAAQLISKKHMSCVVGHQQGKQIAYGTKGTGETITAIIAGSCYEHDEDYMDFQSNKAQWRGIVCLHEVKDGTFSEMFVTLAYLNQRYAHLKA